MSRTRKDRPHWVRLNDKKDKVVRVPYHRHHLFGETITLWTGDEFTYENHCTIDEPERGRSHRSETLRRPCFISAGWAYYAYDGNKETVNLGFWSPLRRDEKDELTKLVKVYNGGEDLEDYDFFLTEKTCHGVYGGGYWD